MTLSNTATPIYYGQFRDSVIRGEVPVNQEVSMQMNLIDRLIANPNFYYDDSAINGFIDFCETEMTLSDGSDLTNMLDSFKLWAEDLLAWFYFVDQSVYVQDPDNHGGHYEMRRIKKRLRNKQYLIITRGAAKTMYIAYLQAYFLVCDKSTTEQVISAPTMKQANETINTISTAITRARGPVFDFLTEGSLQNTTGDRNKRMKLATTKEGIKNFLTDSIIEVRPMSINKLQGLRCKYSTVDEWLSGDIKEDVIGALEQGASKIDDYVIVAVSSEGTVRNGPGDTIKMELISILRNDYYDPHTSIWYYKLDSIDEVGMPEMWLKANPNLGKTVSYETYQRDVERAEKNPATRNDILAKRFNIPMEGYTYFFTYEETLATSHKTDFWGMQCSLGVDLSRGDDFCAFTFLFPLKDGRFGVKTRCYISELTQQRLELAMREKYDEFIKEGSLVVMPGALLDLELVYDELDDYIVKSEYDVSSLGYDPYQAREFIERWARENGPFGIEKVIQGARTESVPLGELKDLASARLLVFDQDIITFTMGNCVVAEDNNRMRKLYKVAQDEKIDAVAALMDALVAYKLHKDAFG